MTFNLPFAKNKSELSNVSRRGGIDNLFNEFLSDFYSLPSVFSLSDERNIMPKLDISENDKEYCIEVEMPGMKVEDVDLRIENNILTIKGRKEEKKEDKQKNYYARERRYGAFQRSVTLPDNVKQEDVNANFENGILCITIPKKEHKTKKITIKSSETKGVNEIKGGSV